MNLLSLDLTKARGMVLAFALLLALPFAFAQLPTPTYGWNLGNTLEPPSGEGTWGPVATQALINAVADSGFNTVRLPVAWDSHANQSTHVIDPAWMARVKQVVDWCYAKNLTVIVNCHWDGGWLERNITDTVDPTIDAKMQSYWTQIANTFKNYDNRLLFAGTNEPAAETAAQWNTLLAYHQTFVNAVRATSGNNSDRWLVIQGPRTDINLTAQLMSSLPSDSASGRLMVEVHYYDPFSFTLQEKDETWGKMLYFWGQGYHHATRTDRNVSFQEEAHVDAQFQKMADKFVSRGIPVIIGEFAAMKRTGLSTLTGTDLSLHLASRTYFHKYVIDSANSKGLKPIYWDVAGLMFDWSNGAITDRDTVRALTGGAALPPPGAASLPNAPSGLAATVSSFSQVNLTWADNATNEESFELDRATNSAFTSDLVTATLSANTTSRMVTGLAATTTYYFRVRATNSAGASEYSGTASVTTSASAPAPAPPTGGTPSSPGGNTGGGGAPSEGLLGSLALAALLLRQKA
jgi:aryl-phospho-beta-D-glucosidase BglC (GH1 family)